MGNSKPFTQEQLEERYLVLAARIAGEYNKKGETVEAEETGKKALLPHLESLGQLGEKYPTIREGVAFGEILECIGYYYEYQAGDYAKAKELFKKALKINIKHYGEDHPQTGITLGNLGNAYGSLGQYEKKKDLLEKALKITIKNFGEEHPDTGLTLANLGKAYEALQDPKKAFEYYQKAYSIFITHNHPHAATIKAWMYEVSAANLHQLSVAVSKADISIVAGVWDSKLSKIKKKAGEGLWEKSRWHWGRECEAYFEEAYIKTNLKKSSLPERSKYIQASRMVLFQAMCTGILSSKKPLEALNCAKEFSKAYPALTQQIAMEYPEFFKRQDIAKCCITDDAKLLGEVISKLPV